MKVEMKNISDESVRQMEGFLKRRAEMKREESNIASSIRDLENQTRTAISICNNNSIKKDDELVKCICAALRSYRERVLKEMAESPIYFETKEQEKEIDLT